MAKSQQQIDDEVRRVRRTPEWWFYLPNYNPLPLYERPPLPSNYPPPLPPAPKRD